MGSVGNAQGSNTGSGASTESTNPKLEAFRSMSFEEADKFTKDAYDDTTRNYRQYMQSGMNTANTLQGLVENLNLHDKPVVLSDADYDRQMQANALDGVELYRGLGLSANGKYQQQFLFGDKTYIGDGVHGEGIYMTTSQQYAYGYASMTNADKTTLTGFIDKSKARVITEPEVKRMMQEDKNLKRLTSGFSLQDTAAYALYKGYNVIHVPGGNSGNQNSVQVRGIERGNDFYLPLTRGVLVMREHTRMKNIR